VASSDANGNADASVPPLIQPAVVATGPAPAGDAAVAAVVTPVADDCSQYFADFCIEIPVTWSQPALLSDAPSCRLSGTHHPEGTTRVVPGATPIAEASRIVRFRVEVEDGLDIDADCFGGAVTSILNDARGWTATGSLAFQRVDDDSYDFRLILASPETTNALCYPAATGGKYSCRNRDRVVLNLMRWESGTDEFGEDLSTYRQYLVNHEVGHLLGHGHRSCPAAGAPAPVMMQQTKGLGGCSPNGWPTGDER
jgi:hypothetical protein